MAGRREAREQALQVLYQLDMAGSEPEWGRLHGPDDVQAFTRELVDGVRMNRERIDALIAGRSEHWRLPRLSRVDLSVLRLATFELVGRPEIPHSVTLNEAVEIARRFGSEESASFVNGVLDHIARQLAEDRRARDGG